MSQDKCANNSNGSTLQYFSLQFDQEHSTNYSHRSISFPLLSSLHISSSSSFLQNILLWSISSSSSALSVLQDFSSLVGAFFSFFSFFLFKGKRVFMPFEIVCQECIVGEHLPQPSLSSFPRMANGICFLLSLFFFFILCPDLVTKNQGEQVPVALLREASKVVFGNKSHF